MEPNNTCLLEPGHGTYFILKHNELCPWRPNEAHNEEEWGGEEGS